MTSKIPLTQRSIPLRRVPGLTYGAAELKRAYQRHLTTGLAGSVVINLFLVALLWLFFDPQTDLGSVRVIRIQKYAEIELPKSFREFEFGLSAYPVLPSTPFSGDQPTEIPNAPFNPFPVNPGLSAGPKMRSQAGDLGGTLLPNATDKLRADEGGTEVHDFNGRAPKATTDDIAGGGGEGKWRRGGVPAPGKNGESPTGFDRSGVGSSAKPSIGTVPYGVGSGPGGGGNGEGGDGFSLQWLKGNSRKKLSGELPGYPEGVRTEAQVRIRTTVLPDGRVKAVQPEQKGNPKLEEAAMRAVRQWKFEALSASAPQIDQTCIVSFLFRLR